MKTSNASRIFVCSLILLLTIFIPLWFRDFASIPDLTRQYRTQSFRQIEGRVASAEVVSRRGYGGEILYHPAFSYEYEVNGVSYIGHRYRYIDYSLDSSSANRIVASHPVGSAIQVYCNPENPAEAVLMPLVDVQDVAHLLLAAPFLYLDLFFLLKLVKAVNWRGRVEPVAGGVKLITERTTTRVRLPSFQPGPLALATTCIVSFIAGFVIPFSCATAPVYGGFLALFVSIGAGAVVYFRHHWKIASGIQDLVIDERTRTLELPLTCKRRLRRSLSFSQVKAVGLEQVAGTTLYAPTLRLADGSSERLTYLDRDSVEPFVAWLWEKLGRPVQDSDMDGEFQSPAAI